MSAMNFYSINEYTFGVELEKNKYNKNITNILMFLYFIEIYYVNFDVYE